MFQSINYARERARNREFSLYHLIVLFPNLIEKYLQLLYSLMRMRSAGILNYLEKKWISQDVYTQSNYLQSNSFQPVEYMHIRLTTMFFSMMVIISVFICILENMWYKLQYARKKNFNSILLGAPNNNLNIMKTCNKMRSRFKWRRKLSSILLSESMKNPEFLQNVTVRINRW